MMRGIIAGDGYCDTPRTAIARTNGAHRVAGLMRNLGVEVEVIDFFNSWTLEELEKLLIAFPVDFVGFSFVPGQIEDAKITDFIRLAKKIYKDVKIIAGGNQVLFNKIEGIDLYFKGFADGAIDDIVEYLETGVYPADVINQIGEKKVIDCNHHYAKFDLANLRTSYTNNDFLMKEENLTLETGRGCIFKCKFCNFPLIGKNKNDYIREKEDVKKELIYNYERWGISQYSITDDTFNDNEIKVDMLYEISQEIDFKLSFMCYARVDLLHARPGSLDKMVAFGVKGMHFGIESMTPITSKIIGKGFSGGPLKDYLREIKQKYPDLHLLGTFIIGLPEESIEQIEANIHYSLDENLLSSAIAYPLGIPKDTGGGDISIFSRDWRNYGYEEMSREELNDLLRDPKYNYFHNADLELIRDNRVIWKSKFMNLLEAELASRRIKEDITPKTCMGGWNGFTTTYTGIPLETLLKLKRTEWDWNFIKQKAIDVVDDYKNKKINALIKGTPNGQ